MRKLATTFGFSTKKSTKDLNSGSKVTCEYWSQGETDATSIDLFGQEGDPVPTTLLVKVTPPQSTDREVGAALGAYCLLIDVSYSMSHEAEITTDGGEKMGFGWSLLDIAKHATSTFISTLSDNDLITIVTYSSAVKTVQEWIKTDATGKTAALAVVKNMRPEVETNLGAGLKAAYEQMTKVPVKPNAIHKYNLQMVVLTDGRPTPEYHPGEGVAWRSYGDHVRCALSHRPPPSYSPGHESRCRLLPCDPRRVRDADPGGAGRRRSQAQGGPARAHHGHLDWPRQRTGLIAAGLHVGLLPAHP